MVTVDQLQQIAIYSMIWSTLTTVIILLSRRDVGLGLKKWFFLKTRRGPLKLRYHGPDNNVTEEIIATRGKGEEITMDGKKMLFFKAKNGSTFFLDEEAIRRTDDGINEISYNYKSTMPLMPHLSVDEAKELRKGVVDAIKQQKSDQEKEGFQGIQMEQLAQYTDPKRLNRLIEYIKLAAKTEALQKATDVEKFVKWGFYASAGALMIGVLVWYTMDSEIIPQLQNVLSAVRNIGAQVL